MIVASVQKTMHECLKSFWELPGQRVLSPSKTTLLKATVFNDDPERKKITLKFFRLL